MLFQTWLLQTLTGDARPEGQSWHTSVSAQELQESLHRALDTSLKAPPQPGAGCAPCPAQLVTDSQCEGTSTGTSVGLWHRGRHIPTVAPALRAPPPGCTQPALQEPWARGQSAPVAQLSQGTVSGDSEPLLLRDTTEIQSENGKIQVRNPLY